MKSFLKLIIDYHSFLISGLEVTILVSIATIVIGMILGTLLAVLKTGRNKLIRSVVSLYVELVRGTPVLVIIAMVFYGLPLIGLKIPAIKFQAFTLDRMLSGILALSISCTAYICEIIRGGIESIDAGQTEAAVSLGFSRYKIFWVIIFPQALKNSLPALGNEFVDIIKASSQVSIITLADLMYMTNMIRSNSFRPFSPFVIAAILYLIMTNLVSLGVRSTERHYARKYHV